MIKIKFNNEETMHEISFSRAGNTVTLAGISEANTSGFFTFRMSGEQLGDFSDFTTIYEKGEGFVTFSNDGTTKPESPEVEEPTKAEPTISERLDAIDSAIAELADIIGGGE